jgi:hypothetical protein
VITKLPDRASTPVVTAFLRAFIGVVQHVPGRAPPLEVELPVSANV